MSRSSKSVSYAQSPVDKFKEVQDQVVPYRERLMTQGNRGKRHQSIVVVNDPDSEEEETSDEERQYQLTTDRDQPEVRPFIDPGDQSRN